MGDLKLPHLDRYKPGELPNTILQRPPQGCSFKQIELMQ